MMPRNAPAAAAAAAAATAEAEAAAAKGKAAVGTPKKRAREDAAGGPSSADPSVAGPSSAGEETGAVLLELQHNNSNMIDLAWTPWEYD